MALIGNLLTLGNKSQQNSSKSCQQKFVTSQSDRVGLQKYNQFVSFFISIYLLFLQIKIVLLFSKSQTLVFLQTNFHTSRPFLRSPSNFAIFTSFGNKPPHFLNPYPRFFFHYVYFKTLTSFIEENLTGPTKSFNW